MEVVEVVKVVKACEGCEGLYCACIMQLYLLFGWVYELYSRTELMIDD